MDFLSLSFDESLATRVNLYAATVLLTRSREGLVNYDYLSVSLFSR